jgi:hypothetical protein
MPMGEDRLGTFPGIAGSGGQVSVWWDGKRHYSALVGAHHEYYGSTTSPAGLAHADADAEPLSVGSTGSATSFRCVARRAADTCVYLGL